MKQKPDWIQQAEEDIRLGKGQDVRKKLRSLQKRGVPQDLVYEVAFLARRVGMYQFATNILFKEVFQVGKSASPEVLAEYAHCLNGVGYYLEAKEVFEQLPEEILKQNAVSYAGSLIHNWDYTESVKILEKYQPSSFLSYEDLVYGLNLTSTQIASGDVEKAKSLLLRMLKTSEENSFHIIESNCRELLGQIDFFQGNYKEASKLFTESEQTLRDSNNVSWLYALKWKVVCDLAIENNASNREALQKVRTQARKFMHWETLRDCDLREAVFTKNSELFNRVYFGTPSEPYRKQALDFSKGQFQLDPRILIGPTSESPQFSLTLETVEFDPPSVSLKMDSLQKNLLISVTKDLYRPSSNYQIFKDVYPEEKFNPISSGEKTGKLIQRFRKDLSKYPAGCSIDYRRGYGYRFRTKEPLALIYPLESSGKRWSKSESVQDQLLTKFGSETFSRKQVCELLDLNERAGNRLIKELQADGQLEVIGSGRATRYKLAS